MGDATAKTQAFDQLVRDLDSADGDVYGIANAIAEYVDSLLEQNDGR